MAKLDSAAILVRIAESCARIRAASRSDDVLDVAVEEARVLAGATQVWAARFDDATPTSVRTACDENVPLSVQRSADPPPLASLLARARPMARADGFLAFALLGCGAVAEGILVLPDGGAIGASPIADSATLDLVLGQLAIVTGLALEGARLRQRVEAVTRARESLLASVSHDLRNPLNTFAMSAGLLRDDLERNDIDATRGIALIGRMERATTRMQLLIEDLVEASRIDARKIDYAIRAESAAQIVREAVTAAAPVATEKGASVAAEALDDDVRVMADRTRTLQLIAKVVAFEAKSTGDGGTIRLGVTRQGDDVVFTARALGPGGASVARPEDGRGGLSVLIARGLAEAQHGTFHVDGDDGLSVAFTLPAAK